MSSAIDPVAPVDRVAPIDLRIVVDGASTAGKTTTARSLGERLGRPVLTPEEQHGRTLLFDWMDHEGGRSDGRPIRTQVVAVPGHLPHLRARLLITADVVLFVADTTASGMAASEVALAQVRTLLSAYDGVRPGLVIQANKRDADDALPLDEVQRRLTAEGDDLVIETVALTGEGVRQSYVYAVRLGLQHARAVAGPRVAERQVTAEALLLELDRDPRPVRDLTPIPDPEPAAVPKPEPEPEPAVDVEPSPQAEGAVDPEPEPAAAPAPEPEAHIEPEPEPGSMPVLVAVTAVPEVGADDGAETGPVVDERPDHDHPRAWRRWFDR